LTRGRPLPLLSVPDILASAMVYLYRKRRGGARSRPVLDALDHSPMRSIGVPASHTGRPCGPARMTRQSVLSPSAREVPREGSERPSATQELSARFAWPVFSHLGRPPSAPPGFDAWRAFRANYRDGLGDLELCGSLTGLFDPIHDCRCFNCTQAGSIR
jgi:hypothetical protein